MEKKSRDIRQQLLYRLNIKTALNIKRKFVHQLIIKGNTWEIPDFCRQQAVQPREVALVAVLSVVAAVASPAATSVS